MIVMRTVSKLLAFFLALSIFAFGSTALALAQSQKRLAFVIGNAAYPAGALATPANDAGLIAQTLQAAGFDVVGARDVDQESLRGAYRDFLAKVTAAGPDAVVFVYLAGQGLQFEGENYFAPVDAQIANAADVPMAAVRISDLTKPLAALPTKVNIVVLDAARPNSFAKSNQPLAGGLALVDPDPNMLIAFNAAPGTVAPEGKGPYGAYAQALAEMIRDGGLQLGDVFDRTRLRVNEVTQGAELPWNASKITEPFVFFDRGPDAPPRQVSSAEVGAMRTKEIRDFDAHDAYIAAVDRDTMRGYEDFLVAYPHDPMARRVRAILAARREAITWRQTWLRDTPEAYWSYLDRYPHGPHAWDARRRLEHFDAALEPPQGFTVYAYDVPPPPPDEIVYVDRPVLYFDDPEFDFAPPPPVAVIFLPPRPRDFIELAPPPPPVGIFLLPTPVFVPVPAWVNPPRDISPPPNDVIFNNIHNTTIINNTTINENNNQGGGLTTGQKLTAGAVGLGAAALGTKVALPAFLQKKETVLSKQNPGGLPLKPGQGGQQPGGVTPLSKTLPANKLTGHALPGADGNTLPLVNGKPVLNGQNLPNNPNLPKQNPGGLPPKPGQGGQQPGGVTPLSKTLPADKRTGHALPGADGNTLPLVNGKPVLNGQNLPKNKSRKLLNNQATAGGNAVTGNPVVNGQNGANGQGNGQGQNATGKTGKDAKLRKIPGANGTSAANGVNNPPALVGQNSGQNPPNGKFKKLHNQGGGQTNGQANGQGNGAQGNGNGPKFHSLPANGNGGGNVQQKFKVNNGNPQLKVQGQPRPQRPEFHAQPKQQMQQQVQRQAQRQAQPRPPQPQPPAVKKPSCGHPNEPACKK
ncbi:caspase family protein [Mesorhizobium jarvisii]|uniref:caspase family protein n=1 Tax=Mesorhizobium jarvisii TaxID=1777867 RepID=UPI00056F7042|nr:caspase domain-containing protein [Mesorhizobium jarvisii]AID28798.2 peptidase C14 caspase catalytic subunit p20 [Mesorhizobium huakuii 7653R]MCH4558374.1 caspase domain-containing protein [Mesorhizobium jarvisii]